MSIFNKLSFKDQAFKLREDAILDATTTLLSDKGFDLMTMDDVANIVGISKPSLYKHFSSKEALIGATLIRLIEGAIDYLDALDVALSPVEKLSALLEWAMRIRLQGGMPFLPSTNNNVRAMLMKNISYVSKIIKLNAQLEKIVVAAQKNGSLNPNLPTDVILFSYYSRTCDPAVEYLQTFSKMTADDIVQHMLQVTFNGLQTQP